MVPTKVSRECNLLMKFKQPEDGREWPTLDEARDIILTECIYTYDVLVVFQRIWLDVCERENWSKYERRMLALVFLEFHFKYPHIKFVQSLFDMVVNKLRDANYDPVYIHFASQLKSV